jgi:flagellar secretion chaperone FliS
MYGHQAYQDTAAQTASPAQLVLMLFDGALTRLDVAIEALRRQPTDLEAAHTAITRVQAIVDELSVSLDHSKGGEVADNLASIYRYVSELLIAGNIGKRTAPLEEARKLDDERRPAFLPRLGADLTFE